MYRDWKLPACFAAFRAELEQLHGTQGGARRYVRVLQLLGEHPLTRVQKAVDACRHDQLTSADAVIQRTCSLAAIETIVPGGSPPNPESAAAPRVSVPLPDLSRFDELIGDYGNENVSSNKVLNMHCCDSSPRRPITTNGLLNHRESGNECSNEGMTMRSYNASRAGENTVFFA